MARTILGKAFASESRGQTLTQKEIAQHLRGAGFVHVTGLPYRDLWREDGSPVEGRIKPVRSQCGRWDYNNGKTVVVTTGGEVWLSAGEAIGDLRISDICPKGLGAFVPMSNSDEIDPHSLLHRVRDPYWSGPRCTFSPVPEFRD